MFYFVLLICLQGEPQCSPMIEDPPTFYGSIEECEFILQEKGSAFAAMLEKDGYQGIVNGQCFKDESVSQS